LPNRIDTLGVPRPGVNVLLGKIAVLILLPLLLGRLDPGPLCDGVDLMFSMEVGLLCDPGSCRLVLLCLHTDSKSHQQDSIQDICLLPMKQLSSLPANQDQDDVSTQAHFKECRGEVLRLRAMALIDKVHKHSLLEHPQSTPAYAHPLVQLILPDT